MFENIQNSFNGLFGKVAQGMCRLTVNGNIAVKCSNGYKSYNVKKGTLTNVTNFCFNVGDEMYNRFDKSLGHVVIESVDDTTYYGDTTNFDITDQDQWGIVRSCENCQCGHYLGRCKGYDYPTVSCYLHEDCGGDEPIIIADDDFVETAMNCKEFEQEN